MQARLGTPGETRNEFGARSRDRRRDAQSCRPRHDEGKPLSQTNLLHRSLYPILEKLEIKKCGFHAMRRFRITHLRKQRAPEDLIRFWVGQAAKSVTDTYSKLHEDVEYRRSVAAEVGAGFDVPASLRPMGPRITVEEEVRMAA